jgi:uncharacterized protein YndB with AHSA1/START domain
MHTDRIAEASISINMPREAVWHALTDAAAIKQYMFGTNVRTDWREGSPITWKGEWKGKAYEDKGSILAIVPYRRLAYSHYSPLSGQPDTLDNYHTVTITLMPDGQRTEVTLTQDNNATDEARAHSEENWVGMLMGLKRYVETHR